MNLCQKHGVLSHHHHSESFTVEGDCHRSFKPGWYAIVRCIKLVNVKQLLSQAREFNYLFLCTSSQYRCWLTYSCQLSLPYVSLTMHGFNLQSVSFKPSSLANLTYNFSKSMAQKCLQWNLSRWQLWLHYSLQLCRPLWTVKMNVRFLSQTCIKVPIQNVNFIDLDKNDIQEQMDILIFVD